VVGGFWDETVKALHHIPGQTERCDGQTENGLCAFSRRNDNNRTGRSASQRISGGPTVGERGTGSQAGRREPSDHCLDHRVFATMKMGRAGRIDH
jgi:hypothetical protein